MTSFILYKARSIVTAFSPRESLSFGNRDRFKMRRRFVRRFVRCHLKNGLGGAARSYRAIPLRTRAGFPVTLLKPECSRLVNGPGHLGLGFDLAGMIRLWLTVYVLFSNAALVTLRGGRRSPLIEDYAFTNYAIKLSTSDQTR